MSEINERWLLEGKGTPFPIRILGSDDEYFSVRDERNALRDEHDRTTDYMTRQSIIDRIKELDKPLELYERNNPGVEDRYQRKLKK